MVPARIEFLPSEEGGRITPAMNGIRPLLKLGPVFTSTVVHSRDSVASFEPRRLYDVTLEIVFWDEYGDFFREDDPVELFEGSRLIARGQFIP